jgi:AraC-like DNA-binding protein
VTASVLTRLQSLVAERAPADGRTDAASAGLRYYRFSSPVEYHKTQLLMPGLVVVLQGRKTARIQQQVYTYDATHCLVLGSEVACHGTVVTATADQPYLAIHLDLPPDVLVKTWMVLEDEAVKRNTSPVVQQAVVPVDAQVLDALARLVLAQDDPLDQRSIAPLVLEEIAIRLLRSPAGLALRDAATLSQSAAKVQRAMQFMRTQYHRPLDIAELAHHSAMSPSHFAHTFRAVAGISPMRYIRGLRLDAARALLVQGGLRASEVAYRVGFESPEHFARAFKRRFGVPASACQGQMAAP